MHTLTSLLSPSFPLPLFNSDSHKRQTLFLLYTSAIQLKSYIFPTFLHNQSPSLYRHLHKMDISRPFFSHFSLTLYKAIFLFFKSLHTSVNKHSKSRKSMQVTTQKQTTYRSCLMRDTKKAAVSSWYFFKANSTGK